MSKFNSISFLLIGLSFFILGLFSEHLYLKLALLFIAAVFNIIGAVKSFKDKKNKRF